MTALVTVEWVARRLGEPEHKVYRWGRDGILPAVRLGRRMKFDPEIIEEWIAGGGARSREVAGAPGAAA